jgi:hypothetical protein
MLANLFVQVFIILLGCWGSSDTLRFGFTNNDPSKTCKSNTPGYWTESVTGLPRDTVLNFFYNSSDDLVYGIDNKEQGKVKRDCRETRHIDTQLPLWMVVNVPCSRWGRMIEIVDVSDCINTCAE